MENPFLAFMRLREEKSAAPVEGVTASIKLQKRDGSSEFSPFVVDRTSHPALAKIVKAFLDSDRVPLGYTTIDKNKGEVAPTMKKKSLWLTGGAVRDHLLGKTIRHFDLVTDATPSEIRMILSHAGFMGGDSDMPAIRSRNKTYRVSRKDGRGKDMEFVVDVGGQQFHLATLSLSPKSRFANADDLKAASTVEEDAANRDFTVNAMYIPLKNADGANTELIDVFGGANDLKSGELRPIGGHFGRRMHEDPLTGLRAINHASRMRDGNLPEAMKSEIKDADMSSCDKGRMRDMFVQGLEHPDANPKKLVSCYKDCGVFDQMFPELEIDAEVPNDLRGDRWLALAHLLGPNNPEHVCSGMADMGWSKPEARDVAYLIKLGNWSKNKFDPDQFVDMHDSHCGLTKGKIRDFMQMTKRHAPEVDQFLDYEHGDLMPYERDSIGGRRVNPMYVQVLGRTPQGQEFDAVRRHLMLNRWKDGLNRLK